ncbi:hypothetical protein [Natronolimnobius baerhuensis]|uniref:hypothetical protein n=1 Tax=Natronolimnobius baerhuensis TaxID=253108 RepID=UPI00112505D5|nr:hypothetical protein [Natronolimnobius baerhuensis]
MIAVPVALVLLPVLVVGAVATNYRGVASRLSQLPGISPDGGLKAGLVAGGGLFVLWGVVLVGATYGGVGGEFGPGATEDEHADEPPADAFDPDADRTLSTGEIVILYETTMDRGGIDLVSAEPTGDIFEVEYQRSATSEAEFLEHAGYVTGAYVGAVGEGLETTRMDATVLDGDEELLSWHVDSEWAMAYHDDEFTMDDVIERSLATAEELSASDAEDVVDDGSDGDSSTESGDTNADAALEDNAETAETDETETADTETDADEDDEPSTPDS